MKVIMLDIDGVLNTLQGHRYNERRTSSSSELATSFCPIATSNLLTVLERLPDVRLVISSTWRSDMGRVKQAFNQAGLPWNRVVGKTPEGGHGDRGFDVQNYLDAHPEVTQYVIVDDDSDFLAGQLSHLVQTNSIVGLTTFDAARILEMLGDDSDHEVLQLEGKR